MFDNHTALMQRQEQRMAEQFATILPPITTPDEGEVVIVALQNILGEYTANPPYDLVKKLQPIREHLCDDMWSQYMEVNAKSVIQAKIAEIRAQIIGMKSKM